MRTRTKASCIVLLLVAFCLLANAQQAKLQAKVIALNQPGSGVHPLLTGPPETVTMKSGYVVLEPGRSVGRHSTQHHEEMLVVLEGQGEMLFRDGSKLAIKGNTVLYCPPETEHDVRNIGKGDLRYVYIVANAPTSPVPSQ